MSKKLVRRDVDLANLPPLTEKEKAELSALVALERYPSELNRGRDSRIGFDLLEDSGRGKEAAGDGAF